MGYNKRVLWEQICASLRSQPDRSLKVLSSELGIERHTVERIVLEQSGGTFRDLQRQLRQSAAEHFLDGHPDLSIKEIAGALGYESSRVFSRFFRASTGKTPSEYRLQREQRRHD